MIKVKKNSATFVGLILAVFGHLGIVGAQNLGFLESRFRSQNLAFWGLLGVWVLTAIILVIVKEWEKKPISSIGFKSISGKEIMLAVLIGIGLSICVPLLTLLGNQILRIASQDGGITDVAVKTSWQLLLFSIITAGITEEILFRGYILERLFEKTRKWWLSISISVIAFSLPHIFSWNVTHLFFVVLPLGLVLSWIYVWKRNIYISIIVHIVIDVPLVVISLFSR